MCSTFGLPNLPASLACLQILRISPNTSVVMAHIWERRVYDCMRTTGDWVLGYWVHLADHTTPVQTVNHLMIWGDMLPNLITVEYSSKLTLPLPKFLRIVFVNNCYMYNAAFVKIHHNDACDIYASLTSDKWWLVFWQDKWWMVFWRKLIIQVYHKQAKAKVNEKYTYYPWKYPEHSCDNFKW